ncbi:hypothetical protein RHAL1_03978 [Beijerinckiaceae bacterium RH AL1]|nr:hypothetical protein RHCH11_RHCH11_03904 [Beijerinckiaceae bacterium RH CH11]VVB49794.1 hypothetical protein RHAL8_03900 [Beijerinckiaceae bacterium RH AL8]VVC57041.1 hypothetical protein RHAL1_03978 [Beijerinckiaceae bacterium RH AL1]
MAILDLRPNCECCDTDLPPSSPDAFICTSECTFCRTCAEGVLAGHCPNCLGNLVTRPIRPAGGPTGGLRKHPASQKRVLKDGGCTQAPDISRAGEVWA